ncbi:MAG: tetratricopeptide repeat protein [bacterium]
MFHLSSTFCLIVCFQLLPGKEDSLLFYKGYEKYLTGKWKDAEEILLQHYDLYPSSIYRPRVLYYLGEINFKNGLYDQAMECWNTLDTLYPESDYNIQAKLRIGDALFEQKKYHSALKIYKEVKNLNCGEANMQEADLKIHEVLYRLGEYKNLSDALYHFIDTNSDTTKSGGIVAKAMLRISRIHLENKEYYSALALLDRLQTTYPDSPVITEALFERANVYKLLGDNQGYRIVLSTLVAKKDTGDFYTYAIVELANLFCNEQKYDSSLHYWSLLRNSGKYQDKALMEIAGIYERIGQQEEAIVVLQSLISDYPESKFIIDAYLQWAGLMEKQGDYHQAIIIVKGMLEKVGSRPEIFLKLGDIYFKTRDYALARENYLLASETFKDQRDRSARALILAGDAAQAMGDKRNARQDYLNARLIAQSEEIKSIAIKKMNRLD